MALLLTTATLSVIIALRYLLISGVTHRWIKRHRAGLEPLGRGREQPGTVRRELLASLLATPIYALPAAWALLAWVNGGSRMYSDPGRYGWWWLPLSALVYLVLHDAYYYWLHRAMHHPRLFGWMHRQHHLSREPTAFAAFAFDASEAAATAWLLPALTFLIPIHWAVALALLMGMTITATLNHCGFELLPASWMRGPFGRWVISATHHNLHHARFRCNYGLHFRVWDRLMGTDVMPDLKEGR
jgi:Delta7-sterol 5-desaturase